MEIVMYRASRYGSLPLVPVDDIGEQVANSLYDPTDGEGDIDEEELYGGLALKVKGKKIFEITGGKKKESQQKNTPPKSSPSRAGKGTTKTRPSSNEGSDSDLDNLEREVGSEETSSDDLDKLEQDVNESFGEDDGSDPYESIGNHVVKKMFGGF